MGWSTVLIPLQLVFPAWGFIFYMESYFSTNLKTFINRCLVIPPTWHFSNQINLTWLNHYPQGLHNLFFYLANSSKLWIPSEFVGWRNGKLMKWYGTLKTSILKGVLVREWGFEMNHRMKRCKGSKFIDTLPTDVHRIYRHLCVV